MFLDLKNSSQWLYEKYFLDHSKCFWILKALLNGFKRLEKSFPGLRSSYKISQFFLGLKIL